MPMPTPMPPIEKRPRKPQNIPPDVRFRICSAGGKAVQASGRAHRFTHEEAVAAGKKGAVARRLNLQRAKDLNNA